MNYLTRIERGGLPHRNELHYDPSFGSDSGEPGADGPFIQAVPFHYLDPFPHHPVILSQFHIEVTAFCRAGLLIHVQDIGLEMNPVSRLIRRGIGMKPDSLSAGLSGKREGQEEAYQDMGPTEFHSDTLRLTDLSCCHPLRSVRRIMK